ncbi:MAG TPA: hypothetical protein H9863_04355 [Candidatus Odoribacter faecigallinarum]|uniref:Uncharacterized protein n=1 Tax=Candidatus Odoribacter faecigallinarum TaxID=2838706 RepID=A0A9D1UZF2_9BACT|nr:hypothetical protein [Candidatus Odoribacter faecigallinarum]
MKRNLVNKIVACRLILYYSFPGWSMDASTLLRISPASRPTGTGRDAEEHRENSGGSIAQR